MQSTYDYLCDIGLKDKNIYAEAFGPSALKREGQVIEHSFAKEALVEITSHDRNTIIKQRWVEPDGSLLEFLENHGFTPSYGCRSGKCGSCKAKLTNGETSEFLPSGVSLEGDEILLCSVKPAKSKTVKMPSLKISLMG